MTTQHSPSPTIPTVELPAGESSGATRKTVQTTSASTPSDGVHVEQPLADVGRPAPCPPRIRTRVSTTTTADRAVRT